MEFAFPQVAGSMYELVRTVEFDVAIDEASVPVRVEIFQATDDGGRFRARVWQRESMPAKAKEPAADAPTLLVEQPVDLGEAYLDFEAEDAEAALEAVLADIIDRLTFWHGSEHSA